MIQLKEGICYSPYPNIAYQHKHLMGGRPGLATAAQDDLQLWNLMWITQPGWDVFLTMKTPQDYLNGHGKVDASLTGYCIRALTMDDDLEDWGVPTLRSLLMLPPREFMREFVKKDIMTLEMTAEYGQPLIQTMWSQARLSQPLAEDIMAEVAVGQATAKVIPFRRRA